jgi:hypothetical protein
LIGKLQARSRLGEVINIVPPIGAGRSRSCRVDGILWAIEKTRIRRCTFGTTNNIDFGFGGTRIVISQQDNWIIYTVSEKSVAYFHDKG